MATLPHISASLDDPLLIDRWTPALVTKVVPSSVFSSKSPLVLAVEQKSFEWLNAAAHHLGPATLSEALSKHTAGSSNVLHSLAFYDRVDVLSLLASQSALGGRPTWRAAVLSPNANNVSPLASAIMYGSPATVRVFLNLALSPDQSLDSTSLSLLHHGTDATASDAPVAGSPPPDVAAILDGSRCRSWDGADAVGIAVLRGDPALVHLLLPLVPDAPSRTDHAGCGPLDYVRSSVIHRAWDRHVDPSQLESLLAPHAFAEHPVDSDAARAMARLLSRVRVAGSDAPDAPDVSWAASLPRTATDAQSAAKPAAAGSTNASYTCATCGKSYNEEGLLAAHADLRHARQTQQQEIPTMPTSPSDTLFPTVPRVSTTTRDPVDPDLVALYSHRPPKTRSVTGKGVVPISTSTEPTTTAGDVLPMLAASDDEAGGDDGDGGGWGLGKLRRFLTGSGGGEPTQQGSKVTPPPTPPANSADAATNVRAAAAAYRGSVQQRLAAVRDARAVAAARVRAADRGDIDAALSDDPRFPTVPRDGRTESPPALPSVPSTDLPDLPPDVPDAPADLFDDSDASSSDTSQASRASSAPANDGDSDGDDDAAMDPMVQALIAEAGGGESPDALASRLTALDAASSRENAAQMATFLAEAEALEASSSAFLRKLGA